MKTKLIYLVTILFIAILAVAFFSINSGKKYSVDVSQDAVVKQLQVLSRYETTAFTIERIIEAGTTEGNALSEFLYGDRILLIAHGEVIGGFDLSGITEENVKIENKNITIDLPAPQILITRLDSDKTRVYDRDQGLLSYGDKDLETLARTEAEKSIKQAACDSGILIEAATNGRTQMETILKTVGFETVIVNIPEGSC